MYRCTYIYIYIYNNNNTDNNDNNKQVPYVSVSHTVHHWTGPTPMITTAMYNMYSNVRTTLTRRPRLSVVLAPPRFCDRYSCIGVRCRCMYMRSPPPVDVWKYYYYYYYSVLVVNY